MLQFLENPPLVFKILIIIVSIIMFIKGCQIWSENLDFFVELCKNSFKKKIKVKVR